MQSLQEPQSHSIGCHDCGRVGTWTGLLLEQYFIVRKGNLHRITISWTGKDPRTIKSNSPVAYQGSLLQNSLLMYAAPTKHKLAFAMTGSILFSTWLLRYVLSQWHHSWLRRWWNNTYVYHCLNSGQVTCTHPDLWFGCQLVDTQ